MPFNKNKTKFASTVCTVKKVTHSTFGSCKHSQSDRLQILTHLCADKSASINNNVKAINNRNSAQKSIPRIWQQQQSKKKN